jgi:hypothetical protein
MSGSSQELKRSVSAYRWSRVSHCFPTDLGNISIVIGICFFGQILFYIVVLWKISIFSQVYCITFLHELLFLCRGRNSQNTERTGEELVFFFLRY